MPGNRGEGVRAGGGRGVVAGEGMKSLHSLTGLAARGHVKLPHPSIV